MEEEIKNVNAEGQNTGQTINVNINPSMQVVAKTITINKHLFVWIGAFLFGVLGVDRFMRGQIGLGLVKLFIGSWLTAGIWALVDWIIAMVKAYSTFSDTEELTFINGMYAR